MILWEYMQTHFFGRNRSVWKIFVKYAQGWWKIWNLCLSEPLGSNISYVCAADLHNEQEQASAWPHSQHVIVPHSSCHVIQRLPSFIWWTVTLTLTFMILWQTWKFIFKSMVKFPSVCTALMFLCWCTFNSRSSLKNTLATVLSSNDYLNYFRLSLNNILLYCLNVLWLKSRCGN